MDLATLLPGMRRLVGAVIVGWLGFAAAADAQPRIPVSVTGQVVSISGQSMVVSAGDGSVPIDLGSMPLSAYVGVEPGMWVRVTGVFMKGGGLAGSQLRTVSGPTAQAARAIEGLEAFRALPVSSSGE